ncbi:MAG: hypothetical protein JO129_04500, partial [Candidatus Dependentiae bacterium]|nr:hypothetical protein [Candidatus Dependentiae bacterium]
SNLILKIASLAAAIYGAEMIFEKTTSKSIIPNKEGLLSGYDNPIINSKIFGFDNPFAVSEIYGFDNPLKAPCVFTTLQGTAFITGIIALLRYESMKADEFAYKNADLATLEGALTLFEDNEADLLFDLENKTMTPFIPTESLTGQVIQTVVNPIEGCVNLILKEIGLCIKSNSTTRWIFDFTQNAAQSGPSIRAQKIRDEITKRKEQLEKQN